MTYLSTRSIIGAGLRRRATGRVKALKAMRAVPSVVAGALVGHLAASLLFAGPAQAQAATPSPSDAAPQCAGLLFATGFDRQSTHGTRDALIEAAERGEPIRILWALDFDKDGIADLSHAADASFLSIYEGEVFTQLDAIHSQRLIRGEGDIKLTDSYSQWHGSIGTNGVLSGAYSDGRTFPDDIATRVSWCTGAHAPPAWTLLYRNGTNGEALAGSKDALFAAIRSGQPIQVAWGFEAERNGRTLSIEHMAQPVFVSLINKEHVVAQLPEHVAQRAYVNPDRALFGDEPGTLWRGLMTTKGLFDAVWVNRGTGEMVRRYPQRAIVGWYAPAAPRLDAPTLALPGGVTRDEARADERFPPPE